MKILQLITLSELGGAQSVVVNLANCLSKEHEVIVAAGEGDGKMWRGLNDNIQKVHIKHLKRTLSPVFDFLALISFIRLYYKYKPDIIHLHSSKAGMLGRIAFPSNKIIYTVHGFDSIRLAYSKFLPIERLMQHACKAIVGVSHYDENNLRLEGIVHSVYCIYNGIDYIQADERLSFRLTQKYKKNILCIARLSPPKNSNLFMLVAKLLPDYAFVWIGNQ